MAVWGKWLRWDGALWVRDVKLSTFSLVRQHCRAESGACDDEDEASRLAGASTVLHTLRRLARYDPRHSATIEQWDANPWLLNTPGGVVDLQTGKMRATHATDYMTKATAIAPGGECPQWLSFLATTTKNDGEVIDYLQRACGYILTGSTQEHALFFIHGLGGNGKSVFLNTLTGIMGTYAAVASVDTFTASNTATHPADLAMLQGARLVTAQETEEGRAWAESRIKAITGGDPVTARFMRQDFFTYQPLFKLFIASNHKPGLRNVDDAMRRRLHLVPFDVKIPTEERDTELPEKLRVEWAGILKWMIHGCLEWQRIGLSAPSAVTSATAEYFQAEDSFGQWLSECAVIGKTYEATSSMLFASFSAWSHNAGEYVGSQKRFSQTLLSRGFAKKINGDGKTVFLGITAAIPQRSEPQKYQED